MTGSHTVANIPEKMRRMNQKQKFFIGDADKNSIAESDHVPPAGTTGTIRSNDQDSLHVCDSVHSLVSLPETKSDTRLDLLENFSNNARDDGIELADSANTEGGSSESTSVNSEPSIEIVRLKKELGLMGGIALIVGNMIGSGIFISPKGVLEGTGSVGLCLIVWAVCGIVSMCGAMGLVELGTMIHKSGGDYAYIHEAYGGLPAFLYVWLSVLIMKPSGAAIMSLTCAEYIMAPFFEDGCGRAPEMVRKMVAAFVILSICAVNMVSVKLANRVSIIFTSSKLIALLIIAVAGFVTLGQGHAQHFANGFENTSFTVPGLAIGFYSGMWAYDGWNNLNFAVEEMVNPVKNVPRAILFAIPLVTVFSILVNISYFTMLSPEELLQSPAVAMSWAEKTMPVVAWLFPVFVALSTFGSTHASVFSGIRIIYAAAQNGHMVRPLAYLHVNSYTPLVSTGIAATLAILMIIPSDIGILTNIFSFTAWIFYGMVAASVLIMRVTHKDLPRPYKVPLVFPVITVLSALFLVISPLVQEPQIEFLYVLAFVFVGLLLYIPFVHYRKVIPFMDWLEIKLQILMQVSPTKED